MVESLEETLRSQHNLDMLCSDRPLYTSELAKINDYYGCSSIIKKYAGLSILYPLKILVQHGIVFSDDFAFPQEKDTKLPSIFCYPPYREQALKKNLSKKIIPSASPFIYLLEMIKKKSIPHNSQNPYRPNSGYALLVNLIAQRPLTKEELLKRYCRISGVKISLAKFSWAVVGGARKSFNSKRHKSAKKGYYINESRDGKLVINFPKKK